MSIDLAPRLRRRFGRALWEMGRAEAVGLATLSLIARDPRLAPEEAAFVVEQMLPEESAHAAITRGFARHFAARPAHPTDAFGALLEKDAIMAGAMQGDGRLAWILATTIWNEVNTVRAYAGWIPVFERLDPAMGAAFTRIRTEEQGHVAWSGRVVARLEAENRPLSRRVKTALRLVRRVYPAVVHQAHSALYQELKAVTSSWGAVPVPRKETV